MNWTKCCDKLPEERKPCVIRSDIGFGEFFSVASLKGEYWYESDGGYYRVLDNVTHWLPIPEISKEE